MMKINLKDFYPWYTHDEYVEIPDEIAVELLTTNGMKERKSGGYIITKRNILLTPGILA